MLGTAKSKIINGIETNSYKSIVELIFSKNDKRYRCTGTYIGADTILTAAHCLEFITQMPTNDTATKRSTHFLSKRLNKTIHVSGMRTRISEVVFPRAATDGDESNDFGFIKLSAQSDAQIHSVGRSQGLINDRVVLVGFGANSDHRLSRCASCQSAGRKRYGINRIDTVASNSIFISGNPLDSEAGLEALTDFGDSGSPLLDFKTRKIIGVLSGSGIDEKGVQFSQYALFTQYRFRNLSEELGSWGIAF